MSPEEVKRRLDAGENIGYRIVSGSGEEHPGLVYRGGKFYRADNGAEFSAANPEWSQKGGFTVKSSEAPSFSSTIKLNPEQQAILDRTTANERALVDLGGQQLNRIAQSVSTPFSYAGLPSYGEADQRAAAAKAEEALLSRLNPQFQRDEEALRSRLINQGIGQGSEAYRREMEVLNQARNDARMQAILGGQQYGSAELASALQRRNQAIQEYSTQRNAPLNEYIGLTSGVQVQNPQFSSQGYQGANPVDYANLVNNQYEAQLGQYNSKVARQNQNAQFLGQLGGAALGFGGGSGSLFGYKLF